MANQLAVDQRIKKILAHMAERHSEPLTLNAIAYALGMSPSTAQRTLKTQGIKFRHALVELRLDRAQELLRREPDIKAEVLSLSVGWKSRKSLYSAVRRLSGRRLAEWRASVVDSA